MAVRLLDLTDTQPQRLTVVEAPLRRQDLRRLKQRYAVVGVLTLLVPFVAAICVLEVAH